MTLLKKKEKVRRKNPSETYFDVAELSKLKYVKVVYMGLDGNTHEISTQVKFIGDLLISLYFRYNEDFNINYPQDVTVKFVTADAMYIAKAVLQEIKKVDDIVYFSVLPPIKMTKRQERRFCRVELSRTGVLVANGTNGGSTTYLSKTINLSGGGVLINNIEKMSSPDFVEIDPSLYDNYYVIIFLEQDLVLKLPARYIRTERVNGNYRYAFQFVRINEKFRDVICKYVTNEQIRQLKLQNRYK